MVRAPGGSDPPGLDQIWPAREEVADEGRAVAGACRGEALTNAGEEDPGGAERSVGGGGSSRRAGRHQSGEVRREARRSGGRVEVAGDEPAGRRGWPARDKEAAQ